MAVKFFFGYNLKMDFNGAPEYFGCIVEVFFNTTGMKLVRNRIISLKSLIIVFLPDCDAPTTII
ncbi:hypothetical protein [Pseudarcicella hirudinis]|uniref:hypothetical protein n=1 Tax=Pseudarcicella hirudinis TaxID=1079859 RepID=UPI0035EC50D3